MLPKLCIGVWLLVLCQYTTDAASVQTSPLELTPISNNVYYLQDYCKLIKEDSTKSEAKLATSDEPTTNESFLQRVIRKIRNVRDAATETSTSPAKVVDRDHDHDHDHDHDSNKFRFDWTSQTEMLDTDPKREEKLQRFLNKSIHKWEKKVEKFQRKYSSFMGQDDSDGSGGGGIKSRIKRELKQIYLDPVIQPSIVVKAWRHSIKPRLHRTKLFRNSVTTATDSSKDKNDGGKITEKCQLLIRFADKPTDDNQQNDPKRKEHQFGTIVNFLKLSKIDSKHQTLRIVTSDSNMTQYWFDGEHLSSDESTTEPNLAIQKVDKSQSSSITFVNWTESQMKLDELKKTLLSQQKQNSDDSDSKDKNSNELDNWIYIELESTVNDNDNNEDEDGVTNSKYSKNVETVKKTKWNHKLNEDTELIVNLYQKSADKQDPKEEDSSQSNSNRQLVRTKRCPIGTFDCSLDGTQCIPNSLRCNGEDNCGNRYDELFHCGTINLYYIFEDEHSYPADYNYRHNNRWSSMATSDQYGLNEGFWFGVRVLVLLFSLCLFLYILSLLCRLCDRFHLFCCHSMPLYERSSNMVKRKCYIPIGGGNGGGDGGGCGGGGAYSGHHESSPLTKSPSKMLGSQMDTRSSRINEYIYVNNNYGQPQGSTTVHTSVAPSRDNIYRADDGNRDDEVDQHKHERPPRYSEVAPQSANITNQYGSLK